MRQFIITMFAQLQLFFGHAQAEIPVVTILDPFFMPFHGLFRPAKKFDFHLFKFTSTKGEIARSDFIAERFTDLRDAKGQFAAG